MTSSPSIILPIESDSELLVEYGRATVLTTNLEYFLKERIKDHGGTISSSRAPLGALIDDADSVLQLAPFVNDLRTLNDERILLIHGTVGSFSVDKATKTFSHIIMKDGQDTPLDKVRLEHYCNNVRELLEKIMLLY